MLDDIIRNINRFITAYYSKYYNKIAIKYIFLISRILEIYIIIKITEAIKLFKLSKQFQRACYLKQLYLIEFIISLIALLLIII